MSDQADDKNKKQQSRRLSLEAGGVVILHPDGPAGGYPMVIPVDHVEDGLHWFLGSCAPINRGETLIVESPIPDDARYATRGTVDASSPATFALRLEPTWHRVQQRAFVRISAHGLQVRVVRTESGYPDASEIDEASDETAAAALVAERDSIHDLLDISAGGIRFRSQADFEPGEEVVCHFELPGSLCFVLPARVTRPPEVPRGRASKSDVAVEFVAIDENTRSQLLRWVYREQVRRNRIRDPD